MNVFIMETNEAMDKKWFHGKSTFEHLINKDVQPMNKVNPSNFERLKWIRTYIWHTLFMQHSNIFHIPNLKI